MASNQEIVFLSHGGGPMPLMDDPYHSDMIAYWQALVPKLKRPDAILLISAHWEEKEVRVTGGASSTLYYDYYGFPPETYQIQYPCPGEPELARRTVEILQKHGIPAGIEMERGLDHGVFVPLKKMYPNADIPVVEMSLLASLDAEAHLAVGQALRDLDYENLLIIGSGFSFHNMQFLRAPDKSKAESLNLAFQQWLLETCGSKTISQAERTTRLVEWEQAPSARLCAPREEHLLPLHVCCGAAGRAADRSDIVKIMDLSCCFFTWH
jgi:aromatic ring-opening dioxygenase catalytic subunit (LigB family)